jgi:hypothetical protein
MSDTILQVVGSDQVLIVSDPYLSPTIFEVQSQGPAGPTGPTGPQGIQGELGPSGSLNIGGYAIAITTPQNNDALMFSSNTWVNTPQTSISDGGNF